MEEDVRFMKAALTEAQEAYRRDEVPIGAVVVHSGMIIGRGHNLTETLSDVTAHAEIQAITAAEQTLGSKYLEGCTVYVTVEPCVMCAGAMYWAKIARLVYGAPDAKYGYTQVSPAALHPKTEVTSGILATECASLMKEFFKNKR
ncbi:MAG: nucleoside deaminase [Paludibacteraceae bacterium]|nr:nucleoside deaminase [Paludibacteraceae bacterium]MBQ6766242.1 nucleoside deaminase [Paludibacteraceae bacterium]